MPSSAKPFTSKKVGGGIDFPLDERIMGSQMHLSELKKARQTVPPEQIADIDAAIAKEQDILNGLKARKGQK